MPILVAEGLRKAYGETRLLDGVDLSIHEGERVGLVGNNGSGKSTLARILVGEEQPDAGRVARRREATIRYLSQEPILPTGRNARDVVLEGLGAWAEAFERHEELSQLIGAQGPGWEAYTEPQAAAAHEVERLGGWENSLRVDVLLQQLGLREMDRSIDEMSGGERRRVALARLLVEEPTLAILDEPTNHLDADTIEWLETHLREQYRGALVLITHDRYVLDRVVNRTLEIDQGKVYSYDGGWHAYLEAKADRLAHADRAEANRQNLLRTELEWLRRSPKARTSKSKARVDRAEALRDATAPKAEQVARFAAQTQTAWRNRPRSAWPRGAPRRARARRFAGLDLVRAGIGSASSVRTAQARPLCCAYSSASSNQPRVASSSEPTRSSRTSIRAEAVSARTNPFSRTSHRTGRK